MTRRSKDKKNEIIIFCYADRIRAWMVMVECPCGVYVCCTIRTRIEMGFWNFVLDAEELSHLRHSGKIYPVQSTHIIITMMQSAASMPACTQFSSNDTTLLPKKNWFKMQSLLVANEMREYMLPLCVEWNTNTYTRYIHIHTCALCTGKSRFPIFVSAQSNDRMGKMHLFYEIVHIDMYGCCWQTTSLRRASICRFYFVAIVVAWRSSLCRRDCVSVCECARVMMVHNAFMFAPHRHRVRLVVVDMVGARWPWWWRWWWWWRVVYIWIRISCEGASTYNHIVAYQ